MNKCETLFTDNYISVSCKNEKRKACLKPMDKHGLLFMNLDNDQIKSSDSRQIIGIKSMLKVPRSTRNTFLRLFLGDIDTKTWLNCSRVGLLYKNLKMKNYLPVNLIFDAWHNGTLGGDNFDDHTDLHKTWLLFKDRILSTKKGKLIKEIKRAYFEQLYIKLQYNSKPEPRRRRYQTPWEVFV